MDKTANSKISLGFLISVLLSLSSPGSAGGGGKDALAFLNLGMGARPMGMAGAFTAVADDVNSLYYNPAGLANLDSFQISFLHQRWIADLSYSYLGAALPISGIGTFAGSLLHLGTPRIEAFDEFNQHAGTFSANDLAFSISYGRVLLPKLMAGITTTMVRETLDQSSANAFSVDLGVLYKLGEDTQIGGFLGNIGTSVKHFSDSPLESSRQAGVLRLGVSTRKLSPRFLGSLEFTKQFDDDPEIRVGGEYEITKAFQGRVGFVHEFGGRQVDGISGVTAGVGFHYESISIDYALSPWGDLGLTHMLGLTYAGKVREVPKEMEREKPESGPDPSPSTAAPDPSPKTTVPMPSPRTTEKAELALSDVRVLLAEEKTREALQELSELWREDPKDPGVLLYTGIGLRKLDKNTEAINYFKAVQKVSKEASIHWRSAEHNLREIEEQTSVQDQQGKNRPTLDSLAEAAPESLDSAVELLKQGKARKSLEVLTILSKRQPRDARIYLYSGLALKSLGKTGEAKAFFEATIKLAPEGSKLRELAQKYLADL